MSTVNKVRGKRTESVEIKESASVSTTSENTDQDCKTQEQDSDCGSWGGYSCWFPLIIFIILFFIVIIAFFCSGCDHSRWTGGCGTGALAAGVLLFFIIWIIIIAFFCKGGYPAGAWFFLFLIFAIVIAWWLASCVSGLSDRC